MHRRQFEQEVVEVLVVLNWPSPLCPEHGSPVRVCRGVWLCAEHERELGDVGSLCV